MLASIWRRSSRSWTLALRSWMHPKIDQFSPYLTTPQGKLLYGSFRWVSEKTSELRAKASALVIEIVFVKDETFIRSGALAASLSLLQAYWKPLKQGEDRLSLVRKIVRAFGFQSRMGN